jgi:hypothetical protein
MMVPGLDYAVGQGLRMVRVPQPWNASSQAETILPILLSYFVTQEDNRHCKPPYMPESWGTGAKKLAKALEIKPREAGVKEELCVISYGNQEHIREEEELWKKFLVVFNEQEVLMKPHSPGSTYETYSNETMKYFKSVGTKNPVAQNLAKRVGLDFSRVDKMGWGGLPLGFTYIFRRLVITGKDTPANIEILFGPQDKDHDLKWDLGRIRMQTLACPCLGSVYLEAMVVKENLDENCPPWSPRPIDAAERKEIASVERAQLLKDGLS